LHQEPCRLAARNRARGGKSVSETRREPSAGCTVHSQRRGMATKDAADVVRFLHGLAGENPGEEPSDGQLLRRVVARRDEAAFAAILLRHGPLVFGVCRQVLRDVHAAEDAFQATFLVLARKAATIRTPESLAAWLHRVAVNISRSDRADTNRRRAHETHAVPRSPTHSAREAPP